MKSALISRVTFALCVLFSVGVDTQRTRASHTEGSAHRDIVSMVRLASTGISEPVDFVVPPNTRSITVVVEGDAQKLYALASLRTADGTERVNVDVNRSYGALMEESYYREQIGIMPGELYQNIRLGTFTATYPYAPSQFLSAGPSRLRVASNATGGTVKVRVLMPEEDGGRVLHINLIVASDHERGGRAGFLLTTQELLAQADIRVIVDQIRYLRGTEFSRIREWSEPQEKPRSQLARLALHGRRLVASDALNIFIVDSLPGDVYGISLGTPGPPVSASYYYGVVLRQLESDDFMGRVFAHEVSHFLGLQHLVDFSGSGARYFDPFRDTESGQGNLMEMSGRMLTPSQKFALSRSALLRTR